MNQVQKITQAYSLTPWRKQVQGIGLFLAILVVCALTAGIYLNVTARAATVGRQIQRLRNQIEEVEQNIADKESKLASLTSAVEMERRAQELGFRPARFDEIVYIEVPGYTGRHSVTLASPPQNFAPVSPALSPAFTQSLLDWIGEKIFMPPVKAGNDLP
jgi:cell division protein FtsL